MTFSRDDNMDNFATNWPNYEKRLVIFLGAGASVGAKSTRGVALPSAYELRNELWKRFKASGATSFDPNELGLMTLQHAAAILEARVGRDPLRSYLTDRFTCDRTLWPHLALRFLEGQCLFTTNYDQLVELAYGHHNTALDVVFHRRKPTGVHGTYIYKPHGSLLQANQKMGEGGLVITQFDYLEMIVDYREMLREFTSDFHASCVLFIGYSFGDMDIGAELFRIRHGSRDIPWYAVFPRDDPDVRNMYFQHLGVRQINRTFEDFMIDLDSRVNFIPEEFKHARKERLISDKLIQAP